MKKIALILFAMSALLTSSYGQTDKFTTENNAEFAKHIANKKTQLVDVRTPEEYQAGHLKGAKNIDVNAADFAQQIAVLDKAHPVAVYCKGGVRSRKAAQQLVEQGYTVYNLDKGFLEWDGKVVK